jgi:hypothetical protein
VGDRLFPQRARHPFVPEPESLDDGEGAAATGIEVKHLL